MNWIAQVGHVSAKDLRYARWSIAALFIALALATRDFLTRHAFGPMVSSLPSSNSVTLAMSEITVTWLPLIVLLVGVMALAALVQADRPLQADSFWTTRPLAPTAVFVAKLLLAVVAITVPSLVAAWVALRTLHTPATVMTSMLAHAALVHVSLLLATIIAAAVTEDMKGFVAAVVLLLGGLLVASGFVDVVVTRDVDIPNALSFAAPVAAVLLLIFLYRGKRNGTWQRVGGFATALLLMFGAIAAPSFSISKIPTLPTGPRVSFSFGAPGQTSLVLPFQMRVDDSSNAQFAFARELTVIAGGARGTQSLMPLHDTIVAAPAFPDLGRQVRWISPPFSFPAMGQLALSPADSHAVARGATSAALSGTVTVLHPRVLAMLPLRDGAFAEKDGRFVSIYGVSYDSARLSVHVHTVNPPMAGRHQPQFVVANFARGEALLLDEHPSAGSGDGWVVLPWIKLSSSFDVFSTSSRTTIPRDSSWYAGASLIAVDWVPTARYQASSTMRLRQP